MYHWDAARFRQMVEIYKRGLSMASGGNGAPADYNRKDGPMPKSTGGKKKPASARGRGTNKKSTKSAPATKAPPARKTPPPLDGSGGKAFYVLAIMALLAAVVFMANRLYFRQTDWIASDGRPTRQEAVVEDKKDASSPGVERKADELKDGKKETASVDKNDGEKHVLAPEREVRLYFLRFDEKTEKVDLAWARRTMRADVPLLETMKELARGLNKKEERSGLLSALPQGLLVRGVSVHNRVAYIDFNEALERNAVGNILMSRIDQIVFTATQFDGVDGVVIKINGVERTTLGPDGLALARPLTRSRR